MKILVVSSSLKPEHIRKIRETAMSVEAEVVFAEDDIAAEKEYFDAEVIYGFATKIAAKSRNLKWLCVPSAGVDFLMKPGAFANEDCLLTKSSGAYGVSVAEHIIAVSLMMMRQLTAAHEEALRGVWGLPRPVKSLKDCRITVLGTGDIGRTFARRAAAFEPAALIGVNRGGVCKENCFDRVEAVSELDRILPQTDLLIMCLPDTPETRGILARKRMELLSEGAYVVNVGRGSAIDENALCELLEAGRLAGAALDVFQTEPLPGDSPLWKTKNLLITPHISGKRTLKHTLDKNVDMFCEDLFNYAESRPLKYLVDRKKGY